MKSSRFFRLIEKLPLHAALRLYCKDAKPQNIRRASLCILSASPPQRLSEIPSKGVTVIFNHMPIISSFRFQISSLL